MNNPEAFRGRSVEIESNNVGSRRLVFFHENSDSITAVHVSFDTGYSHITGALKLMKDSSPSRMWRPAENDQNGAGLFALGLIDGQEATSTQLYDFTPLDEALEALSETS